MIIESIKSGRAVIIKVSGRMDAESASTFEEMCQDTVKAGNANLIADFTDLEYVSSMGLRSILAAAKTAQDRGGNLTICGLRGLPKQVFEMTRLLPLFPVFESRDAALQSV